MIMWFRCRTGNANMLGMWHFCEGEVTLFWSFLWGINEMKQRSKGSQRTCISSHCYRLVMSQWCRIFEIERKIGTIYDRCGWNVSCAQKPLGETVGQFHASWCSDRFSQIFWGDCWYFQHILCMCVYIYIYRHIQKYTFKFPMIEFNLIHTPDLPDRTAKAPGASGGSSGQERCHVTSEVPQI